MSNEWGFVDKDGNPLSVEEADEFIEDLWDCGIPPPSKELLLWLWSKWGERLGMPRPEE